MQFRFAPTLTPTFSQWEREEEREAIRQLNPAIPGEVVSACAGIRSEAGDFVPGRFLQILCR
jgi:hypothetical protein